MTAAARVQATRAYLTASALLGAALLWIAFARVHPVYGSVLASMVTLAALWWWRGVFSRRRVVLWLEERLPGLRYSLAALIDAPDTRFRRTLETQVHGTRFGSVLALAGLRLVGLPLALLVGMEFVVRPLVATVARTTLGARLVGADGARAGDARGSANFLATVTSPGYARLPVVTLENPTTVTALVGSSIRFSGGWTGTATMPARAGVLRLQRGDEQRMVALEPRADSTPRVVLERPARDTVLPVAGGVIPLAAIARDDIGIISGRFEVIVSSGSGESFTFRSAELGRVSARGARDLRWESALDLDSLRLQPGDVVHLRATARDANPAPDAEAGSSETRTLRVFRRGESDSISIEGMLPPEVGQSELSQRMLIMMTERLVAQERALSRSRVGTESGTIGVEQGRLRRRVGEIIFTRLTGEEDAHDEVSDALADTVSPGEALLRAAEAATVVDPDEHAHDEGGGGPVINVNRPLLEAFNAMWDAERRLRVGEPRAALPHMRVALEAIQRARAAERLYLRGRPPNIVIDLPRVRLSGKREGIDPGGRGQRSSAVAPALARRERFLTAIDLLTSDPAGGGWGGGPWTR
ncbi:MAG: hypothetical protein WD801_12905 [Gemmatimonadaceae bacterium]